MKTIQCIPFTEDQINEVTEIFERRTGKAPTYEQLQKALIRIVQTSFPHLRVKEVVKYEDPLKIVCVVELRPEVN